jgi:hypothetical protein
MAGPRLRSNSPVSASILHSPLKYTKGTGTSNIPTPDPPNLMSFPLQKPRKIHTSVYDSDNVEMDDASPPEPPASRSHCTYDACHTTTGMLYTDPIDRFLAPTISGNCDLLVMYEYDGNYIHNKPMPDHMGPSIIAVFKKTVAFLEARGFKPILQFCDNNNEASLVLHNFMTESDIDFQLAPPHIHRHKVAE